MEQIERIARAIDFIEENLFLDDLATERIAAAAELSPWHFQRVFSALTGETVKAYVRKRRLSAALAELGGTRRRIIEIAVRHGFESQEAFTRAFKAQFGITPGRARRDGVRSMPGAERARASLADLEAKTGGVRMEPRFVTLGARTFVGVGGPYICITSPRRNNHVVVPKLWDEFLARRGEIAGIVGGRTDWGLSADLPADEPHEDDEFWYLACAEVTAGAAVPAGMCARTVPAAEYAVFTHRGPLSTLGQTIGAIYGSWLPRSGRERADAPDLELYDHRFDPASPASEIDLYVPLAPLGEARVAAAATSARP